jgi:hypothetical protein
MSLNKSTVVRGISVNALFGVPRPTPRRGIFFSAERHMERRRFRHLSSEVTPLICLAAVWAAAIIATFSCIASRLQSIKSILLKRDPAELVGDRRKDRVRTRR